MVATDRGTRFQSTGNGGQPGDKYFDKAKILIEKEMAQPSITTVQTALLLGSRYGAVSQHSLGWTYSGMAIRMAIELGLHVNCNAAVAAGQLSTEMAELRKLVFWGCYIQDKLWSAYTGRPSFIMDWDITLSKPETPFGLCGPSPSPNVVLAGVHQNIVLLTVECSNILRELYSQKHGGRPHDLKASANSIHGDLLKWHKDLPEALRWPNQDETPSSPHVLLMHMQFYFTLILLHRPFIDFHGDRATFHRGGGEPHSPIAICTLAATNITKLSRDYSLFYNLRQIPSPAVHFVFVAATIHLLNHHITEDGNDEFLFQGCFSGLVEIAESYPSSRKAVSVLQEILHQLQSSRTYKPASQSPHQRNSEAAPPVALRPSPDARRFVRIHRSDEDIPDDQVNIPTTGDHVVTPNEPHANGYASNAPVPRVEAPAARWNFDLEPSTCNSPVVLPSSLNDIDIENFALSSQGLSGNPGVDFIGTGPLAVPPPDISQWSNLNHMRYGIARNEYVFEPAVTLLDRFYGTPHGLNPHNP